MVDASALFNISAELPVRVGAMPDARADALIDQLSDYGPVLVASDLGRVEIIFTVPAQTVWQATTTARAILTGEGWAPRRVIAEPTEDFDRRSELDPVVPIPPLISVTEAAERLGITRAAVGKRLRMGMLQGQKVGDSGWVIPAAAVPDQRDTDPAAAS